MRLLETSEVADVVEHERALEVERALERELGNPPARRAEPALPHSSTDPPGSGEITSTPGASSRSWSGVPARIGNVP